MFNSKKTKIKKERSWQMMKKSLLLLALVLPLLVVGQVFALTDKPITASATVTGSTTIDVKLYKSLTDTTYDWTTNLYPTMTFPSLVHAVATDPTTALTAAQHFLALVAVTSNSGATYKIQYTGAPLRHTDAVTTLSNDAWTVIGGNHLNTDGSTATVYPAGVNTSKKSAGSTTTYDVYTSNATGTSDTIRVYFAITGDPTKGVDANGNGSIDLIPPTQKSGSYSASVKLTLYP